MTMPKAKITLNGANHKQYNNELNNNLASMAAYGGHFINRTKPCFTPSIKSISVLEEIRVSSDETKTVAREWTDQDTIEMYHANKALAEAKSAHEYGAGVVWQYIHGSCDENLLNKVKLQNDVYTNYQKTSDALGLYMSLELACKGLLEDRKVEIRRFFMAIFMRRGEEPEAFYTRFETAAREVEEAEGVKMTDKDMMYQVSEAVYKPNFYNIWNMAYSVPRSSPNYLSYAVAKELHMEFARRSKTKLTGKSRRDDEEQQQEHQGGKGQQNKKNKNKQDGSVHEGLQVSDSNGRLFVVKANGTGGHTFQSVKGKGDKKGATRGAKPAAKNTLC